MKQSVKAYLPKLNPLIFFNDFIANIQTANKYIAHCVEGNKSHFKDVVKKKENILVLIGPEGDFSREEITAAARGACRWRTIPNCSAGRRFRGKY